MIQIMIYLIYLSVRGVKMPKEYYHNTYLVIPQSSLCRNRGRCAEQGSSKQNQGYILLGPGLFVHYIAR